jgi:nucleotide-binding universal stress UspA family protein
MIIRAYQMDAVELPDLHYRRILVPLDGSQRAEAVLPMLNSLVQMHHAELVLAHVVARPEMPRRAPLKPREVELLNEVVELNQMEAARYLEQLQARLPVPVETRIMVGDNIESTLHHLADKEGVDLVLLSAHGYSAENRFPYGSVVISFIAYGTTPLLIIQDLPENDIERSQAEMMAAQFGNGNGGRMVVYDRPSI